MSILSKKCVGCRTQVLRFVTRFYFASLTVMKELFVATICSVGVSFILLRNVQQLLHMRDSFLPVYSEDPSTSWTLRFLSDECFPKINC